MANKSPIVFAQYNMSRARHVTDEIRLKINENGIDILLLQEPYAMQNEPATLGSQVKIQNANSREQHPWAAIAIANDNIVAINLKHFGNDRVVVAEVTINETKLYAISAYLSPNQDPAHILGTISRALNQLRGATIIKGLDSNAYSTTWGSTYTNREGEVIEDFMGQHGLSLLNKASEPATFFSNRGSSYVDITLARGPAVFNVRNWHVELGWTLSDHRVIVFQLHLTHHRANKSPQIQPRFKTKLRNYQKFNNQLVTELALLPPDPTTRDETELFAQQLGKAIINTANKVLKKTLTAPKSVPWWTPQLTALKAKANKARRHFQRSQSPNRDHKRLEYVARKAEYVRALRRARRDSWRNFVDKDSTKNPWGMIYKLCSAKIKIRQAATAVQTDQSLSNTWEDSMNILLDALVIPDKPENDTLAQRTLRERTKHPPEYQDEPPFTLEEVEEATWVFRSDKAPGIDSIDIDIIKGSWPKLKDLYLNLTNACLFTGTFPIV